MGLTLLLPLDSILSAPFTRQRFVSSSFLSSIVLSALPLTYTQAPLNLSSYEANAASQTLPNVLAAALTFESLPLDAGYFICEFDLSSPFTSYTLLLT